jgi:hypothetical protein
MATAELPLLSEDFRSVSQRAKRQGRISHFAKSAESTPHALDCAGGMAAESVGYLEPTPGF